MKYNELRHVKINILEQKNRFAGVFTARFGLISDFTDVAMGTEGYDPGSVFRRLQFLSNIVEQALLGSQVSLRMQRQRLVELFDGWTASAEAGEYYVLNDHKPEDQAELFEDKPADPVV